MSLPTYFASLTTATGQELDNNFAALGALVAIPCDCAGTNSLTLVPNTLYTPDIPAYFGFMTLVAKSNAANTGVVTAQYGSYAAKPVYKNNSAGPVALAAGDIPIWSLFTLVYNLELNSGAGGWYLGITVP